VSEADASLLARDLSRCALHAQDALSFAAGAHAGQLHGHNNDGVLGTNAVRYPPSHCSACRCLFGEPEGEPRKGMAHSEWESGSLAPPLRGTVPHRAWPKT